VVDNDAMSVQDELVEAFELHSVAGIRRSLSHGASAVELIGGKRPVDILIEMYTRSAGFSACMRTLLDAGATVGDPLVECVLLDDGQALARVLEQEPGAVSRRVDVDAAYTCCQGVTALHLCAEFNSVACARVLLDAGADVNARAAVDADGLGGQTPLFHAVNSNQDYCRPMLELLVASGADVALRLKGLVWGAAMDWETVVFDVTPISYAQCGLYRQFHREERHVYANIELLYAKLHGGALPVRNVPNRYVFPPK
jgi:hypothetical protein